MLRSATRVWVVTRAPASRQIVAAARSKATPLPRKLPACGHATGWPPKGQKCDGTGTGARSRGGGATNGEGAAGGTSVWGKWCWDCLGWW